MNGGKAWHHFSGPLLKDSVEKRAAARLSAPTGTPWKLFYHGWLSGCLEALQAQRTGLPFYYGEDS